MPAASTVHIDTLLTGVASGHKNTDYVGDLILPIIPVAKESGRIAGYGNEHYRLDFQQRAMGADTPRGDWSATSTAFSADEWSFEIPVDDRQRALYDDPFDAESDATLAATEKILLKREDIVGTLLATSGNFGGTTAGTAWGAGGTPRADISAAIAAITGRTGMSPARLWGVTSFAVFQKLLHNTTIQALFINTERGAAGIGELTPQAIAGVLGLAGIIVGYAVKNTAKEGDADVFAPIFSATTFAIIGRSQKPSLMQPGWGVILSPTVAGFKGATIAVDKYREESKRSDIIRAGALFDAVKVTANVGQLITNIT